MFTSRPSATRHAVPALELTYSKATPAHSRRSREEGKRGKEDGDTLECTSAALALIQKSQVIE